MPCPHFQITICSRGKGGSAVVSAAYNSGEKLFCEYDDHTKNYIKKKDEVIAKGILLPEHAPRKFYNRETLWNSVESAEPNYNSQLARKIILALPKELSDEDNKKLLREYCNTEFVSNGMIVDYAIHRPPSNPDNIHAHILLPMRAVDENENWMPKCHKQYPSDREGKPLLDKNGKQKSRKVPTTDWDNQGNAEKWRTDWGNLQNEYLERAGLAERVCMDSFEKQGKEEYPTVHMGQAVCALEARGIETDIGSFNRMIQEINRLIKSIAEQLKKLTKHFSEVNHTTKQLDLEPKELRVFDLCRIKFNERQKAREDWKYPNNAELHDLHKMSGIFLVLDKNNISTIPELEKYLVETRPKLKELQNSKKSLSRKKARVDGIIKHAERKKELESIYKKAHSFGFGRKKYIEQHRAELEEWETCDRYLKVNLKGETYQPKALKLEELELDLELGKILQQIKYLKEDLDLMSYAKYLIRDYIPELTPPKEPLSEEQKTERRESVRARLQEKKKIVNEYNNELHMPERNHIEKKR